MFSYEYDDTIPALVSIVWGKDPPRLGFEAEGPLAARLAARANELGRRAIYIQALDREVPPADAKLRQEIADRANSHPAPFDYAMITDSFFFRGVVSLVMWFRPPTNGSASAAFANEGDAIAWVEKRHGKSFPELHAMYARVRLSAVRTSADITSRTGALRR